MSSTPTQIQVPYESYAPPFKISGFLFAILGSTLAWCCVITLAATAFEAKSKGKSDAASSPTRRRWLLCYVTLMTGISTAALVQRLVEFRCAYMVPPCEGINAAALVQAQFPPLMLAILGADLLMVWRCWVLYQGVRRLLKVFIDSLLTLFVLSSFAFSVYALAFSLHEVVIMVTIGINFALSILITTRLLVHERAMKAVFGEEREVSPFKKAMALCVESCALIVLCGSLVLGTYLTSWEGSATSEVVELISATIMTHICVISPLLLIVRVANGRAHSTTISSFATEGPEVRNAYASARRISTMATEMDRPLYTSLDIHQSLSPVHRTDLQL